MATVLRVAGFDFGFQCDPRDVVLLRGLVPLARSRARKFRVRWHFELDDAGFGYVTLDGHWAALDLLLERLQRDLPTGAEALPSWRAPAARRRLGLGFARALSRRRNGGWDGGDNPVRLRLASKPDPPMFFILYPDKRDADLRPRLAVTMDVLAGWLMDEVAAEVVLEELHTAAELLLTRLWGRSRRLSFAELVEHAEAVGVLADMDRSAVTDYEDEAAPLSSKDLLLQLKDERKAAKHRGAAQAQDWLVAHFWPAARLIERVTWALDRRADLRDAGA